MNTAPADQEKRADAPVLRQRERRRGFTNLVAVLCQSLGEQSDASLMRGAFEEMLRRIVPVRSVTLRDASSRWFARPDRGDAPESIALDVPVPHAAGVLEATFGPGTPMGEWDFQTLGAAAHLGALVLEIERTRLQLARAGLPPWGRPRRDPSCPLLGATPAMEVLRERIARVAATDFTVLVEGESGVGKELVARQIHDLSRRRNGPFVAHQLRRAGRNAVEAELFGIEERTATGVRGRRGKFEHADGGTLFLDEVSDLSLVGPGQAAASHPGPGGRAGRRPRHAPRRYPDRRGHEPRPGRAGRAQAVPAGPVLPIERCGRARAARSASGGPTSSSLPATSSTGTAPRVRCARRPRRPMR